MITDSAVLNYFEETVRGFIVGRLDGTGNWWESCIPSEVRQDASSRHGAASRIADVLNKPSYDVWDYINFDGYGKIMSRRDNWRNHFEAVFMDKQVFDYKMKVILSLRNDVRHGRRLDRINSLRLRIHCYDILSQIHEKDDSFELDRDSLIAGAGLQEGELP